MNKNNIIKKNISEIKIKICQNFLIICNKMLNKYPKIKKKIVICIILLINNKKQNLIFKLQSTLNLFIILILLILILLIFQ